MLAAKSGVLGGRSSQKIRIIQQHGLTRRAACRRLAAAAAAVLASDPPAGQHDQTRPPQQLQQVQHDASLQLHLQLQQLQQQVSAGQRQAVSPRRDTHDSAAGDAELTAQLKAAAGDWRQLVQLVRQQGSTSSSGQATALQQQQQQQSVAAQAKPRRSARRQQHQEQQELEQPQQVQAGLRRLNPLHLSCILSSLAKQQQPPPPAALGSLAASRQSQPAALGCFAALVFAQVLQQLPRVGPREASNILWASAKLEQPPAPQQLRALLAHLAAPAVLARANTQDLSMALYAAAVLGLQVPDAQLQALLQAFALQLAAAGGQALANTLWAVAVLQHRPPEQWLQALEVRCCVLLQQQCSHTGQWWPGRDHQRGGFASKGCHQLLWSLARLQWVPQPALQQLFWAVSAPQLPAMSPQGTTGLLWAAATLSLPPPQSWLSAWYEVTRRQMQEGRFGAQDVANALWALVRLRQQPDSSWLAAAMSASRAVLGVAGSQELSNMLWAAAKLGLRPDQAWMNCWLQAMLVRMRSYCAPALASSAYSLALLCYRPPGGWCEALLAESQRQMAAFGAQELSNLVWALAVLGLKPSRQWLQDFQMQSLSESGSFNAQELSVVAWSLARLGCRPPAAWLAQLLRDGLEAHGGLAAQSVAMLMWALVRWRLPEVWEGGEHRVLLPRYWAAAEQLLPGASLTQLSLVLWARVRLGSVPSASWQQSFWAAAEPALLAVSRSSSSSSSSNRELITTASLATGRQPHHQAAAPAQSGPAVHRSSSSSQRWTQADVVRLVWAAGQVQGPLPDSRTDLLLAAAQAVLPGCSFGALTSVGVSLLRIHRQASAAAAATATAAAVAVEDADAAGGRLLTSSSLSGVSRQQAVAFWRAWLARSTLLLQQQQQQSGACELPQQQQARQQGGPRTQQRQQQRQQQPAAGISARDLSTQLNTVWQLRLQVPEAWAAAAAAAVPGVLPSASLEQVSWIVSAVVKLRLDHRLLSGWAEQALQRCLQELPAAGRQIRRSRGSGRARSVVMPGSAGPALWRLRQAARVLKERGQLSTREWQMWLQLEAVMPAQG